MKTELHFTRHSSRLALLLALLSTLNPQPSTLFAQGTAFTYQGRLTDAGSPANGTYDFRFRLSSDALGNNFVGGPLLSNAVAVGGGLFVLTLNFGTGIFNGSNYWLQVDVKTNGAGSYTTVAPLQPLTPTPYAIFASAASNLSGTLPSSQLGGTYPGAVILNNPANSFTGNGGGLTNVNAATLGGLGASQFWNTGGNSNTIAGSNFIGTADNQSLQLAANSTRALRIEPNTNGAPNMIGGSPANFVDPGVVGATIAGGGAVVGDFYLGTGSNRVAAIFGTIGGGRMNTVAADHGFIGGGILNTIQPLAFDTVIGGGVGNTAQTNAYDGVIAGGQGNTIQHDLYYGAISGGQANTLGSASSYSTIAGGTLNTMQFNDSYSTIGGGLQNTIQSNVPYSTISGGQNNTLGQFANQSTIGGGGINLIRSNAASATISGGSSNSVSAGARFATVSGGSLNVAGGISSTVSGGERNVAQGLNGTIGGGLVITIRSNSAYATIGGGAFNSIGTNCDSTTISGGFANVINDLTFDAAIGGGSFQLVRSNCYGATIGGGGNNTVNDNSTWATIAGGYRNLVQTNSPFATIGGGLSNLVQGAYATVPGGFSNAASASYAFAAGQRARAIHTGAFVWADSQNSPFSSTTSNQFNVRASGGARFVTGAAGVTVDGAQTINGTDGAQLTLKNSSDNQSWLLYDETFGGSGALIFQPNSGVGAYISRFDGTYHVNSDVRLKRDIVPLDRVLDRVLQLQPVSYHFRNAPEGTPPTLGLIAQEVQPLFPEVVGEHGGTLSMAYSELIPVTIRAVQELDQKMNSENAKLREELKRRDAENAELKQRLDKIERLMSHNQ